MAMINPSVQQNLGQPNVIPETVMSPRMQRQAVISNLAQNLIAAGTRSPIVNPAQALDQARQSQMGLNVQQSVLDDRARQEQALRQQQEAQQQQQAVLMEINKQYSGNPRGKFEALMQTGFTDVANKYADAMKSAGMPIVEEVRDTRTDDIKEFGEAYPTMVDKNGNVKDDPVSSAAFMAYMKDIKKSGASNIVQNAGSPAGPLELSATQDKIFQENHYAPAVERARGMSNLKQIADIVEQRGDEVLGWKGSIKAALSPLAATLGLQTDEMSDAQLLKVLFGKEAGSKRLEVVGSGQVSNYEQKILQQVSGGKMSSAEGLKKLIQYTWDKNAEFIAKKNEKIADLQSKNSLYGTLYDSVDIPETPNWFNQDDSGTPGGFTPNEAQQSLLNKYLKK